MKKYERYTGAVFTAFKINLKTGRPELGWGDDVILKLFKSRNIPLKIYVRNYKAIDNSYGDANLYKDREWESCQVDIEANSALLEMISGLDKEDRRLFEIKLESASAHGRGDREMKDLRSEMRRKLSFSLEVNSKSIIREVIAGVEKFTAPGLAKHEKRKKFREGSFFHVSMYEHKPGSTITGGWQGASDEDTDIEDVSMQEIEDELEKRRPAGAVSRMNSVFVFDNYSDAVNYRDTNRKGAKIYVVKPVGKKMRVDMRGVDAVQISLIYGEKKNLKRDVDVYWSGMPNKRGIRPIWEYICTKVKVVDEAILDESKEPKDLLRETIIEVLNDLAFSKTQP